LLKKCFKKLIPYIKTIFNVTFDANSSNIISTCLAPINYQ